MTTEIESVEPELRALRAEVEGDPTAAERERVFSRLEASLAVALGAAASPAAHSEHGLVARAGAAATGTPAKFLLLGTFALGGALGAGTVAVLHRVDEPRVVYVDRAVATKPAPEVVARPPAPLHEVVEPKRSPVRAPTANPEKSASVARALGSVAPAARSERREPEAFAVSPIARVPEPASLAEQQALLDQARAALGTGDGPAALDALELHGRRHPESVLAEEREALAIKALASVGRGGEARSRLQRFEKRFPRSPLLPSVRAAAGRTVTETER